MRDMLISAAEATACFAKRLPSLASIHTHGGFAEYVKAPWKNCYQIPDELDDFTAAFIEPLTTVIHAAQRMDAVIGGSVAVIGCGLGILHGAMAKARACAPSS